jgi:PAS domain S-box-containing protein
MMLRTRFAVVLGGAALALTVVTLITARIAIVNRAIRLDEEMAHATMKRGMRIVVAERDSLLRAATDWARRDDAYAFMGDRNQLYMDVNLGDSTLQELRLDSLVFFDARKRVFHAKTAAEREVGAPPSESVVAHIRNNVMALDQALQGDPAAGFVCVGDALWLVAVAPVLKNLKEGPVRGALMMVRWMGPRERASFARLVGESLRLMPADRRAEGGNSVTAVGSTGLEGHVFIRGLDGGGASMVLSLPRRSFTQGIAAMFYLVGWIAVCGGFIAVLSFVFLDRWVLQELTESVETLRTNVDAVASAGGRHPRVWKRQSNEMGDLADSINAMLDSLENSEMHLRASEARYRGLVEATPEAIAGVNEESRLIFANRAFLRWTGVEAESLLVGRRFTEVVGGEAGAEVERRAIGLQAGRSVELGAIRGVTTNVERWITAVLTGIASGESQKGYVLVCMNDVTSRTMAEREAENRRAEAVQAQKLAGLGTLVAGVAHEVNNPNSIVNLNMNLMRRLLDRYSAAIGTGASKVAGGAAPEDLGAMEREMNEIVTETLNASTRIAGLVASLKRFAQPAGERMTESVDINEVVRRSCDWMRHDVQKRRSCLETVLAPALPAVKGNSEQLQQVFMNLVQNGLNAYGATGGFVRIATSCDPAGGTVVATVRDDGAGIRSEDLDRIMDPFFTTRRLEGGTGLGLSISAAIVKGHGGSIRVESEVGKGTLVTVTLPIG